MTVYQYHDLPQIPSYTDEPAYAVWPQDQYGHINHHPHTAYQSNNTMCEDMYNGVSHRGMFNMQQPMQRFLFDSPPISQNLLHAKLDNSAPLQMQQMRQYEQWPSADCFPYSRNGSPDATSVSGTSSHATHNEIRSPHPFHSVPSDFSQPSVPYSPAEHLDGTKYGSDLPMAGGSINPRQLQYQQQEPEPVAEEHERDREHVDLKPEVEYDQEPAGAPIEAVSDDYQPFADSAIGNSLRDAESVQPMSLSDQEESDSDYKPNSKTKRRRTSAASNSSGRQAQKRRGRKPSTNLTVSTSPRIAKKTRGSNGSPTTSKAVHTHGHSPTDGEPQRPFPCPLATYGCASNFVSKNEWKRHVGTQHIKLGFWRCDLCATTVDPHDDGSIYHNDFNRKDLFTQHLRRMHAAPTHPASSPSRAQRNTPFLVTEDNIVDHQQRCYQSLRNTPPQSGCLFCEREFAGPMSWEERMEHVGKHLEKERKGNGVSLDPKTWRRDELLEQWLLDEGLIEPEENGEWKIGSGVPRRSTEPQPEEEDDD